MGVGRGVGRFLPSPGVCWPILWRSSFARGHVHLWRHTHNIKKQRVSFSRLSTKSKRGLEIWKKKLFCPYFPWFFFCLFMPYSFIICSMTENIKLKYVLKYWVYKKLRKKLERVKRVRWHQYYKEKKSLKTNKVRCRHQVKTASKQPQTSVRPRSVSVRTCPTLLACFHFYSRRVCSYQQTVLVMLHNVFTTSTKRASMSDRSQTKI